MAIVEMEATCARLAAMTKTPIERHRLEARHQRMVALVTEGDPDRYADASDAFHSAIYGDAHNPPIAELAPGLRRRLAPFRRAQSRIDGRLLQSNQEHEVIVQTILSGNAAAAHAAMLHHVSLIKDAFETFSAVMPKTRTL